MSRINDDDLVFYDEEAEKAREAEEAEMAKAAQEENDFGSIRDNPYIGRRKAFEKTRGSTDNPDMLRRLRENEEAARIERRKTSKSVGNFWLELLIMLTFSPRRFKAGLKRFMKFFHLGVYRPEDPDCPSEDDCEKLYLQKQDIFWTSVASRKFLKSALFDTIIVVVSGLALRSSIRVLSHGAFFKHPFRLIWTFIIFEVFWNVLKVLLKLILNVMKETYLTVMGAKKESDAVKKAAKAAREKAEKEAREKAKDQTKKQKKEPIAPSRRGRNYRSGGT